MGYYINYIEGQELPTRGKAAQLIAMVPGTRRIERPTKWEEGLVCVLNNGLFDAAGYCFNEREMQEFAYPDGRPRTWLIVPNAAELSGYRRSNAKT